MTRLACDALKARHDAFDWRTAERAFQAWSGGTAPEVYRAGGVVLKTPRRATSGRG